MSNETVFPDPVLLVVGARPGSLGQDVFASAMEWGGYRKVFTAGISGEMIKMDVTNSEQVKSALTETRPDHIVVTTGVNESASSDARFLSSIMMDAFRVNVIGVMDVLRHWIEMPPENINHRRKFVAISSNSARIPRTHSMPYCASKAALSMALRVAAREMARCDGPVIWGYEPGLLNTVMTREMFPEMPHPGNNIGPFHRMEGVPIEGLDPLALADRIIGDLRTPGFALNGCMIPFDGGEL